MYIDGLHLIIFHYKQRIQQCHVWCDTERWVDAAAGRRCSVKWTLVSFCCCLLTNEPSFWDKHVGTRWTLCASSSNTDKESVWQTTQLDVMLLFPCSLYAQTHKEITNCMPLVFLCLFSSFFVFVFSTVFDYCYSYIEFIYYMMLLCFLSIHFYLKPKQTWFGLTWASPAVCGWQQRRWRWCLDVLELLWSSHTPIVLALPDIQQGGCRVRSRCGSWNLWFLLHILPIRLALRVGVCRVSWHNCRERTKGWQQVKKGEKNKSRTSLVSSVSNFHVPNKIPFTHRRTDGPEGAL